ncbi:hypothetical protein [Photobacterium sanguinicancri]|uniref:Uncharacterized protein n=1 Tax=Photobacterium sanguinicancri TaxID=875932 RepID=A0ABX4FYX1_9GAMM|nr:hypothetical protein [Photobacterium sanguinicancri]OZS43030.1 hypothetical protein ASV53_15335 [Photobacterium sanguinicancri]
MEELSMTRCNQHRLHTAIYNVQNEPSIENWQALLAAADMINWFAIDELSQLKAELAKLTASAMSLSLPLDDADGEEVAMLTLGELNSEIEDRAQSFIELNAIRLDAKHESNRARQALESQHS